MFGYCEFVVAWLSSKLLKILSIPLYPFLLLGGKKNHVLARVALLVYFPIGVIYIIIASLPFLVVFAIIFIDELSK